MKVLVPHGDPHMRFGIVQLEDGSIRASSPCCGAVFDVTKDPNSYVHLESVCTSCTVDWQSFATERSVGLNFEGRFHGGGTGEFSTMPKVIIEWIRRVLNMPDAVVEWEVPS